MYSSSCSCNLAFHKTVLHFPMLSSFPKLHVIKLYVLLDTDPRSDNNPLEYVTILCWFHIQSSLLKLFFNLLKMTHWSVAKLEFNPHNVQLSIGSSTPGCFLSSWALFEHVLDEDCCNWASGSENQNCYEDNCPYKIPLWLLLILNCLIFVISGWPNTLSIRPLTHEHKQSSLVMIKSQG